MNDRHFDFQSELSECEIGVQNSAYRSVLNFAWLPVITERAFRKSGSTNVPKERQQIWQIAKGSLLAPTCLMNSKNRCAAGPPPSTERFLRKSQDRKSTRLNSSHPSIS